MNAQAKDVPPGEGTRAPSAGRPETDQNADLPQLGPAPSSQSHRHVASDDRDDDRDDERVIREAERAAQHQTNQDYLHTTVTESLLREKTKRTYTPAAAAAAHRDGPDDDDGFDRFSVRTNPRNSADSNIFDRPSFDRRQQYKPDGKEKFNAVGRFLAKVHGSHVFIRYFTYIIPLMLILLIPLLIGAFATKERASVGGVHLMWFSIWLVIVWLTLWAARLISSALPTLFATVSVAFTNNQTKWRTMGRRLELPCTLFLWWLAIEISFLPTMTNHHVDGDKTVRSWERTMNKVLVCFMVGAILNFAEKVLIQLIAMSFHLRTYQDRIEFNKDQIAALTRMYAYSKKVISADDDDFEDPDGTDADGARCSSSCAGCEDEKAASRLNLDDDKSPSIKVKEIDNERAANAVYGVGSSSSIPASPNRLHRPSNPRLSSFFGKGGAVQQNKRKALDKLGGAFRKVANDFSGSDGYSKDDRAVVMSLLSNKERARVLARRLFRTFSTPEEDVVLKDAFMLVFDTPDEVQAAFWIFDKDLNGDISMEEMQGVCAEISDERKSISESLQNMDSVISKLDSVFLFIIFVIVILVFISVLSANAATAISSAGSTILALSWLFSATAQEFLQSIIFVFVKHPFDVGDRVTIYGNTGNEMKGDDYYVKKISLLYTEFKKLQGHVVQAPNSYLNTLFILNQRRSGGLAEAIELRIKFGTSLDQMEELQRQMTDFVTSEKREYMPNIITELREVNEVHMLKLNVVFFYKSNWQDELVRLRRRNKFLCALMIAMQECGIEGPRMRYPGQKQSFPVYIQHALHQPHPNPASWGTPDHPDGLGSIPEGNPFLGESVPGGGRAADAGGAGDGADPNFTAVNSGDNNSNNNGQDGASGATTTGIDLGRFQSNGSESAAPRRRGSNVAKTGPGRDYSLGLQNMCNSELLGDNYEQQDRMRQQMIQRAFGRSVSRRQPGRAGSSGSKNRNAGGAGTSTGGASGGSNARAARPPSSSHQSQQQSNRSGSMRAQSSGGAAADPDYHHHHHAAAGRTLSGSIRNSTRRIFAPRFRGDLESGPAAEPPSAAAAAEVGQQQQQQQQQYPSYQYYAADEMPPPVHPMAPIPESKPATPRTSVFAGSGSSTAEWPSPTAQLLQPAPLAPPTDEPDDPLRRPPARRQTDLL